MSITIETLLFELDIDTSSIDRKLDAVVDKAARKFATIDTAPNNAFSDQLDSIEKRLTRINKLSTKLDGKMSLDIKQSPSDTASLKEQAKSVKDQTASIKSLKASIDAYNQANKSKSNYRLTSAKEPKGDFEKTLTRAFKKAAGSGGSPLSFVTNSFTQIVRGFREQIGASFAAKISQGYIKTFEASIGSSLENVGEAFSGISSNIAKQAGTAALAQFNLSPAQAKRKVDKFNKFVTTYLIPEDIIISQVDRVSSTLVKLIPAGLNADTKALSTVFKELKNDIIDLTNIPKEGFKQFKRDQIPTAVKMAQRQARGIVTDPTKTDKTVMVSGGFAGQKGESGKSFAKLVAYLTQNQNVTPVPVSNVATDTKASSKSFIKWTSQALARSIEMNVVRGINPDAIAATAQAIAVKRDNPKAEISMMGHSSGGTVAADVRLMADALELGIRSIGIGTPDSFMTDTGDTTHQQLLTVSDAVRNLSKALRLIGFDTKPNKATQSIPSTLEAHEKGAYTSNPVARELINAQMPTNTQLEDKSFSEINALPEFSALEYFLDQATALSERFRHLAPRAYLFELQLLTAQTAKYRKGLLADSKFTRSAKDEEMLTGLGLQATDLEALLKNNFKGASPEAILRGQVETIAALVQSRSPKGSVPQNLKTEFVGEGSESRGSFNFVEDVLSVQKALSEQLSDPASPEFNAAVKTFVHEIRHAVQKSMKKSDLITLDQTGGLKNKIKAKALASHQANIAGQDYSPRAKELSLAREVDAYAFEEMYGNAIASIITKAREGFEGLYDEILPKIKQAEVTVAEAEKAVPAPVRTSTQLLGIGNPKNAKISQISRDIKSRLPSDEFTVAGLKEIAKQLGKQPSEFNKLNKAALAEFISDSNSDDDIINAIHLLGDRVKSQGSKSGRLERRPVDANLAPEIQRIQATRKQISSGVDQSSNLKEADRLSVLKEANQAIELQIYQLNELKKVAHLSSAELKLVNSTLTGVRATAAKIKNRAQGQDLGQVNRPTNSTVATVSVAEALKNIRQTLDPDVSVGNQLDSRIGKIKESMKGLPAKTAQYMKTEKGRDLIKEGAVNTAGAIGASPVGHAIGLNPIASEMLLVPIVRKLVTDIESSYLAYNAVINEGTATTKKGFRLFAAVVKESHAIAKTRSPKTKEEMSKDMIGTFIGGNAANALSGAGMHVPLQGAAVAIPGTGPAYEMIKNAGQEGKNYVKGFVEGIDPKQAADAAMAFGLSSIVALKKAISSKSPSKKTAKEGDNWVDGLVLRLIAGVPDAKKASTLVGNATLEGLRNSLAKSRAIQNQLAEIVYKSVDIKKTLSQISTASYIPNSKVNQEFSTGMTKEALALFKQIRDEANKSKVSIQTYIAALGSLGNTTAKVGKVNATTVIPKVSPIPKTKVSKAHLESEFQRAKAAIDAEKAGRARAAQEKVKTGASSSGGPRPKSTPQSKSTKDDQFTVDSVRAIADLVGDRVRQIATFLPKFAKNELLRGATDFVKELSKAQSVVDLIIKIPAALSKGAGIKNLKELITTSRGRKISTALAFTGYLAFANQIKSAIAGLFEFRKAVEQVEQKLKSINFASRGGIFDEFGKDANKAGVSVLAFADQYATMSAALRNKVADPREVVNDLSVGLASRGVSGESQSRAMTALSQMASKGVVSMEELRQQLGEALPNAMGLAARSMGLTESQLMRLVTSGQLASSDFIPKFADEISKASEEINTLAANQARLGNEWDKVKFEVASIIPFNAIMKSLAVTVKALSVVAIPLATLLGGVVAASFIAAGKYALAFAVKLGLTKDVLLAFGKTAAISGGILAAIAIGFQLWRQVTDQANEPIRKSRKELERLATAQKNLNKLAKEGKSNYQSGNFVANWTNRGRLGEENRTSKEIGKFQETLVNSAFEFQVKINPESIARAQQDLQPIKDRIKALSDQLASKDALGLSQVESNTKRSELSGLEKQMESELESRFGLENLAKLQSNIDLQRQYIQQAIDAGANEAPYKVLIGELDVKEEALAKLNSQIKSFAASMTVNIDAGITARADKTAIAGTLSSSNSQRDLNFYKSQGGQSSATQEIAERAKLSQSISQQIGLYSDSKKSQEAYISTFSATSQDLVKSMSGASSLSAITPKQLAKLQEAAKLNDGLSEESKQLIEALSELVGTGQDLKDANVEQAKAAYDAANRLRDIKIAVPKLQLAGDRIKLDQGRFNLDQDKKKDEVGLQGLDLEQQAVDFRNQLIDLKNGFLDFNLGIKDSIRQINTSSRDLALELVKAGQAAYQAAVDGFGTFSQAAGLEDILGLGKLSDVISKAAAVKASDQRPALENAKADAGVEFSLKQEERERRKAELIRTNANVIGNIRREEERAAITQSQLMKDEAFNLEDIGLRYREMQIAVSDHNREISGVNAQLAEAGDSTRIGQVDFNVDLNSDPQAILDAMQLVYGEMSKNRTQAIAAQQAATNQQVSDINRLTGVETAAFKSQQALKDQQIKAEGERYRQATEQVKSQAQGTLLAFTTNLQSQLQTLTDKANQASASVLSIFAEAKMPVYNVADQKVSVASQGIDKQLSELKAQKTAIDQAINASIGGLGKDKLMGMLSEGVVSGQIDAELGNQLMADFAKATSSDEFKAVIDKARSASTAIEAEYNKLASNTNEILERIKELATRDFDRKLEDVRFEQKSNAKPDGYQTDLDKKQQSVAIEAERLEIDAWRQLQDMEGQFSPEQIQKYGDELRKLNKIKLDQLKKEASGIYQLTQTATQGLETGIQSMLVGIGDALLNRGDSAKAEADQMIDYGNKLGELKEKYGNDPDLFLKAKEDLDLINGQKLDGIKDEFSILSNVIDLAKSALNTFAKSMLDAVAQMAAQSITKSVVGGLGGILSGGGLGGFGSILGGLFGQGTVVDRAGWGGTIGGSTDMTQGGPIGRAMAAEGKGAIPIVAHKGEEILSTRNKDAQFQRALKKSGEWDRMKNVAGYANGGTVGGNAGSYTSALRSTKLTRPRVNNYATQVSYNLHGDSNSLRQSVSQIEADRQRRQAEIYKRNK